MSTHNQGVNIEVNKGIASMAGLVCFIGAAFFASTLALANPFVAGCIASVVAYGLAYTSARFGAFAIMVGVALFLVAYNYVLP